MNNYILVFYLYGFTATFSIHIKFSIQSLTNHLKDLPSLDSLSQLV